jgi:hypothetical protein
LAVLAAVGLVVVLTLAVVSGTTAGSTRNRVVAGLVAWLGVDVVVAAVGGFAASRHNWFPLIIPGLAVPMVAGIVVVTRVDAVIRWLDSMPQRRLIGVQVFRVAGLVFLLGWADGRIPGVFALPAGIGDIAVGLAAPLVASHLRATPRRTQWLAVVWNIAGIVDLVAAVTLGFLSSPSPMQQISFGDPNYLITRMPFVLIPTYAVPLAVTLHVASLRRLRRARVHLDLPLWATSLTSSPA